jgi:hypothetical protein
MNFPPIKHTIISTKARSINPQSSTRPALCFVHIPAKVLLLLGVHTKRSLPQNCVLGGIIMPSGSNDLVRRNAVLDPLHHGKQDIMSSVSETRDAVDT